MSNATEVQQAAEVLVGAAEDRVRAAWAGFQHAEGREAVDQAQEAVSEALSAWNNTLDAAFELGARVSHAQDVREICREWNGLRRALAAHA